MSGKQRYFALRQPAGNEERRRLRFRRGKLANVDDVGKLRRGDFGTVQLGEYVRLRAKVAARCRLLRLGVERDAASLIRRTLDEVGRTVRVRA